MRSTTQILTFPYFIILFSQIISATVILSQIETTSEENSIEMPNTDKIISDLSIHPD